jgi:protein TonB
MKSYIDANYKYIVRLIRRKMVYPDEPKKKGISGTTTVAFSIDQNGQVSRVRVNRSSGDALLDEAALSAVQRAAPFPPPPAPANIAIPLIFRLK